MTKQERLRGLPSVDRLLSHPACAPLLGKYGRSHVANAARETIETARERILSGHDDDNAADGDGAWIASVSAFLSESSKPNLRRVINCSGIVAHTNLGRALLAETAADAAAEAAMGNVDIEYDIEAGGRGDRDDIVEGLIVELTGAEAATVVNNNAAAVLLTLNTLSHGRETIVSRGELIEIGGSFRLPEIMVKSGCVLKEVGTTNRTHLADYENAATDETALVMRAHTSNYRIVGFTAQPALSELAALTAAKGLPLMVDLGSGTLVDLQKFGLPHEPTVQETLAAGADMVTISGDKLLGGPQAGVIAGRAALIDRIKKNPLKRALRCGKMTLAALETTLRIYRDPDTAPQKIPTLRHLSKTLDAIRPIAERVAESLRKTFGEDAEVTIIDDVSQAGSGSLPEIDIPTLSVAVRHKEMSPDRLAAWFRALDPPVIGRVENDLFRLDMRCVDDVDGLQLKSGYGEHR